ncbi:hypothetical protein F4678DRAFT_441385 [Xylaria arbuscula]|nr:hypothetical protein F4678DRAFT_441385 [Xylaria arbuscula]
MASSPKSRNALRRRQLCVSHTLSLSPFGVTNAWLRQLGQAYQQELCCRIYVSSQHRSPRQRCFPTGSQTILAVERGLEALIKTACNRNVKPHNLITTPYHLTPDEALHELQGLIDLVRNAVSCKEECQSEAAWNALVHCRVFEWALARSAGKTVKSWLTTSATIVPEVAPGPGMPTAVEEQLLRWLTSALQSNFNILNRSLTSYSISPGVHDLLLLYADNVTRWNS